MAHVPTCSRRFGGRPVAGALSRVRLLISNFIVPRRVRRGNRPRRTIRSRPARLGCDRDHARCAGSRRASGRLLPCESPPRPTTPSARLIEMAARGDGDQNGRPVSAEELGKLQDIPHNFLQAILADLRKAGVVHAQRGQAGGWRLAKAADDVTVADVIRAVDGPLVVGLRAPSRGGLLQRARRRAPARLDRRAPLPARRLRAGLRRRPGLREAAARRRRPHRGRGRLAAPLSVSGGSCSLGAVTQSTKGLSVRQSSRTASSSSGVWMIGSKP